MTLATFRQLEVFVAVASRGSFTQAAAHLHISQVTVSRQIAALEANLGCRLFVRRAGSLAELSPDGLKLVEQAPELLEQARHLPGRRNAATASLRVVRIAAGEFLLESILQPHIAAFQIEHPALMVEVTEIEPSVRALGRLKRERIDLAYITLPEPPERVPGKCLAAMEAGLLTIHQFRISLLTPRICM